MGDETGAASVLIIFMMIVLVTLGAFAISSAHVNYSFSRKALEWNMAYYDCDTQGEQFLADYDVVLAVAEKNTAEHIMGGQLTQGVEAASAVQSLYEDYIQEEMRALTGLYPEVTFGGEPGEAEIHVRSGEHAQIRIQVAPAPLAYRLNSVTGILLAERIPGSARYQILRWEEWQEAPDAAATQEPLWDGNVERIKVKN